ncbi:MAG: Arc family DNA-binding protein [Wenzhouxiangellaceae bacterium]
MPNLSIKNVPEDVVAHLRSRARANHRSLQGELLALVSAAAEPEPPAGGREPVREMQRRERGSRTAEQIWAALRATNPEPVTGAPSAVEIIRADRDGR